MADFCWDCCHEKLDVGGQLNDLKGLCEKGETIIVLCEGCGEIMVDDQGQRVDGAYGIIEPKGKEGE
jgi:hypothetical protein